MKLYDLELSGNCYKVRLFLNLLQQPFEKVTVNVLKGEHKSPEYLSINPKGQIPTLADGECIISDSQAILVYLAEKFEAESWYPKDAQTRAEIQFWLSTAANEAGRGPADARLVKLFGAGLDYNQARQKTDALLNLLEQHLQGHDWLVGDAITIADIAVFPYVGLAGDAEISLEPYPAVRAWLNRITTQPNFIGMPGLHPAEQTV
ncbi:glutathione S-transferase family protein [Acanthopleuribacter pedis]|uniref:Glutathione S-transferase family protein n=1 Tax=Acanthopleuribacter pedis TaxID=442870 RepID=A0A8J7QCD3_9BACT|nr:glutathione S-transferase family protein [Acanthopleuribacter pedis]MBO1318386.1 glutathione S-transferase family protein [Acanthopleuribacter pedis]